MIDDFWQTDELDDAPLDDEEYRASVSNKGRRLLADGTGQ